MADIKTTRNDASVDAFLSGVDNEKRREDCQAVVDMMRRLTGEAPAMWGPSIIGFGSYHYTYDSGREGDFFLTGVSPRKQALTVYIMPGFSSYDGLMTKLGKHKTGRSCLYIKKLEDVDLGVLEELITKSVAWMRKKYHA
ncbi:MAG: DUF1801 domain-containing protein [Pseudomonadota bacterium]